MRSVAVILSVLLSIFVMAGGVCAQYQTMGTQQGSCTQPPMCQPAQTGLGPFPSQMAGPTCMQMSAQPSSQAGMAGSGPGMMGMMCGGCGSIAVDDTTVYVLQGMQILQYNKSNMQLLSTTTLPSPVMPQQPAIGGQGRGPMMIRPDVHQLMTNIQSMSSNQAERTYMMAVIQSHAGAISWSRLAASRADHSQLRQFARSLINDESGANQQFSTWLRNWYDVDQAATLMPADQSILDQLQNMSGRDFEIAYIRAMITHFSEAIALSSVLIPKATHPELANTASSLASGHSAQIQQLQSWLSQWYGLSS